MAQSDAPKKYDACTPIHGPAFISSARQQVGLEVDKKAMRDKCCPKENEDCFGSVSSGDYTYYKKVINGQSNQCVELKIDPDNITCANPEKVTDSNVSKPEDKKEQRVLEGKELAIALAKDLSSELAMLSESDQKTAFKIIWTKGIGKSMVQGSEEYEKIKQELSDEIMALHKLP